MGIDPLGGGVTYEPQAAVRSEYAGHSYICCSPFRTPFCDRHIASRVDLYGALGHVTGCCARAARLLITGQERPDVQDLPHICWREEEAVMTSKSAEPAHGSILFFI